MKVCPPFVATLSATSGARLVALTCYYLAIIVGLIIMYGKGDFSTPGFIYQGF